MRYSGIGGQAVMEGVMMKNKNRYAVAVRKPDHEIEVMTKEYKGIVPGKDEPKNGGSYVKDTKDAHEKYNFKPELLKLKGFPEGEYCLGFVETKSTSAGKRNQLNIEKIEGCSDLKNDTEVDDVLVVYCALYPDSFDKETYVVGWYKHATVYRRYEKLEFDTEASDNERSDNESAADEKYIQLYNAIALKEDCVLLPRSQRRKTFWRVPRKKKGVAFGFGQSNVWFARGEDDNKYLSDFLDRLENQIETYDGENWIDRYAE